MNLQENIRNILREEDYSPAGKEVTPNNIVIHKSNPMFRDKIMENGLKVRAGECYKVYVGYGIKCKPAIFATNSTNKRAWFDSTYDDDIWEINTEMIPDVKWYKDRHFESRSKHIVTFQDIPKEAITLKYKGTGSGDVETWGKNSPNLYESIRRILREETKIPSSVKRRLHYVDEYIDKLESNDVCNHWSDDEADNYVSGTLSDIVRIIIGDSSGINSNNYGSVYDVIYEFLVNLNYPEQIKDFFYEALETCSPKSRMKFKKP